MMIKMTYKIHRRSNCWPLLAVNKSKPLSVVIIGREQTAYFPTHKAAIILLTRWNQSPYLYEVVQLEECPWDTSKFHPDCNHYSHLVS